MATPRLTEPAFHGVERGGSSVACEFDSDTIRGQLDRILSSPLFRNSRRNSSLLRHVVERALVGRTEELKERNIGMDVFARAADYDTNTDHIVRSVAGEVRRRLAQYYMEPGREGEPRIDLVAGSYVPQFRFACETQTPALPAVPAPMEIPSEDKASSTAAAILRPRSMAIGIAACLVVAAGTLLAVRSGPSAVGRFWNPFFSSPTPTLLCFGGGGQSNPASAENLALSVSEFEHLAFRRMHTMDAVALADVVGVLQANRKPYRIINRASSTSFSDLQSGPFVLIGGMNNEWTLRLTSGLRFSFEKQPNGARVVDKNNPANTAWSVDFTTPVSRFNRDYAIVSRVRDPKTEQTVVIVAGIGSWGTLAAGQFVSHPEHLEKLEKLAPSHWEQKNLQAVLATDVIRGSSGPPILLSAHFW
jgi:hypothetical protein